MRESVNDAWGEVFCAMRKRGDAPVKSDNGGEHCGLSAAKILFLWVQKHLDATHSTPCLMTANYLVAPSLHEERAAGPRGPAALLPTERKASA